MTNLPYRFRDENVRRYAPVIEKIIELFPSPLTIDPSHYGLAGTTFSCRLRDAITSYCRYAWRSATFPVDRLRAIKPELRVTEKDGLIVIGDNVTTKKGYEPATIVPVGVGPTITVETEGEARILGILATYRLISQPLAILTPPPIASFLADNFDVSLDEAGPNTYKLI
jgi:hypothetical protein